MALRRICPICNGSGTDVYCRYTGYKYYGNTEDILGLFLTHEIMEATDPIEYSALSDANKDVYKIIISAGTISLLEGGTVRAALEFMFPGGTTTRANLDALTSLIEVPEALGS